MSTRTFPVYAPGLIVNGTLIDPPRRTVTPRVALGVVYPAIGSKSIGLDQVDVEYLMLPSVDDNDNEMVSVPFVK